MRRTPARMNESLCSEEVVKEREEPRPPPTDAPAAAPDPVDEAGEETFPGSDPPAWSPSHAGAPGEHPDDMRPDRPRR